MDSEDKENQIALIDRFFTCAGHPPSNQQNEVQTIYFDDPLLSQDYTMIELDKHLADEVTYGRNLYFRGNEDEFPVLCSDSRSYLIKEGETSNSVLLLPTLHVGDTIENGDTRFKVDRKVVCMRSQFIEARPLGCVNKNKIIEELISNDAIVDDPEKLSQCRGVSIDSLLDKVQMSRLELNESILTLPIVALSAEGGFVYLTEELRGHLLSHLTDMCENASAKFDWRSFEPARLKELLAKEHNIPEPISDTILRLWTTTNSDGTYIFVERKICAAQARVLLKHMVAAGGRGCYDLNDLMRMWQLCVPDGMIVKEEYLHGLGVLQKTSISSSIQYLPRDELSTDIGNRLAALFAIKKQWLFDELSAYLIDLCNCDENDTETLNKQIGAILMKHCRSSITGPNKTKHYCARY